MDVYTDRQIWLLQRFISQESKPFEFLKKQAFEAGSVLTEMLSGACMVRWAKERHRQGAAGQREEAELLEPTARGECDELFSVATL